MDSAWLTAWLWMWVGTTVLTVHFRMRQQATGSGLVVAYLLNLWAVHGLGAFLYVLPWWRAMDVAGLVESGFRQATAGLIGAAIGSVVVGPFVMTTFHVPPPVVGSKRPEPRLAVLYVLIGIVCYLVLLPLASRIPSATALVASGWQLLVVGLALMLWKAWHDRRYTAFKIILLIALGGLPLLTVAHAGFLGYGSSAALTLLVFTAAFVRPRWKMLVAGAVLGYLGLSYYVTYMRDRGEIRAVVWEAQATVAERAVPIWRTLTDWEWLDLRNEDHLQRIDERLNQNFLVGAAVQYLETGMTMFVRGATIRDAFLAIIPRALWPEKPLAAGSGYLVSDYTGIAFAEGTSVGIGQIMEFYVNFGTVGVMVGCLIVGTLLSIFDSAAGQRLRMGDWQGFSYWYLPGIGLLNVGGSLTETIASVAAAFVTAYLANRYLLRRFRSRETPPASDSPSRA